MEKEKEPQVKEPVKIRFRKLKNGNTSIYLDLYLNGIREYEFLNIYLRPGTSRADKEWNKEQLRLANAVKSERIVSIQNGEFGFKDIKRTRRLNFIQYLENMATNYEENGQTACGVLMRSCIRRLVDYKGRAIPFSSVNKEYLIGFIDYLNNERYDFDKGDKKKDRKPRKLSGVYKEALFARVMVALNKAEREGIILKNPGKSIDANLKPRAEEKTRAYLTLEEVKKIADTDYRPDNDVKPAFMFACFTGLRYSDIFKLTWGELTVGPDGTMRLDTKMKKTGKDIYIPLSDNAIAGLPSAIRPSITGTASATTARRPRRCSQVLTANWIRGRSITVPWKPGGVSPRRFRLSGTSMPRAFPASGCPMILARPYPDTTCSSPPITVSPSWGMSTYRSRSERARSRYSIWISSRPWS